MQSIKAYTYLTIDFYILLLAFIAIYKFNASLNASNALFRQHLDVLKQNIVHSRLRAEAIGASCMNGYKYTSLEETKEFIKVQRGKPLTMKEARMMVETQNY